MKTVKDWLLPVIIIAVALGAFALTNHKPQSTTDPGTAPDTVQNTETPAAAQDAESTSAIPFTARTVGGKSVSLSDYKGKVLLMDFWASWCPPCRAEAPNVVAAYRKYHAKGFDVLGISLDQDKGAMKAFEQEVGMTWPQVFDADNGNAMADKYNVEAIPTMLLVDGTTGKILAENPRGGELDVAVASALKAKRG